MLLTIAIPSFRREETLLRTLSYLREIQYHRDVDFLVINNGYLSSPYQQVKGLIDQLANFNYVEYPSTDNFFQSFLRIFMNCESEYVMLLSDEDHVKTNSFEEILNFLKSRKPNLLVLRRRASRFGNPFGFRNTRLGSKNIRNVVTYISGIVFNVQVAKFYLSRINAIGGQEEFVKLYPASLLSMLVATEGAVFSSNSPLIVHREKLETSIKFSSGNSYSLPTERVLVYESQVRCMNELRKTLPRRNQMRFGKMIKSVRRNCFGWFFDSVFFISEDVASDLVNSSFKTFVSSKLRRFLLQ